MSTFRDAFYKLVPSWLGGGAPRVNKYDEGERVLYSLNFMLDAFAERARLSLLARFPTYAPADALQYLGRDRKIVRGINEPADVYAQRLLRWLDDHRVRGNPYALMAQLREYCQADVRIRTVDRRGNWYTLERDGSRSVLINLINWDWDGGDLRQWSRFWVIIYPTPANEPWAPQTVWGTGGTTGTTATVDEIAGVRRIIKEWKPAGTRCEWIIVAFDDASFDPTDPSVDPGGTWGTWGADDGGVYLPVRLTTARYWLGSV